jgi:hypothetical protein
MTDTYTQNYLHSAQYSHPTENCKRDLQKGILFPLVAQSSTSNQNRKVHKIPPFLLDKFKKKKLIFLKTSKSYESKEKMDQIPVRNVPFLGDPNQGTLCSLGSKSSRGGKLTTGSKYCMEKEELILK